MNPNLTIIIQIISSSKPVSLFRRLCSDFLLQFENGLIAPLRAHHCVEKLILILPLHFWHSYTETQACPAAPGRRGDVLFLTQVTAWKPKPGSCDTSEAWAWFAFVTCRLSPGSFVIEALIDANYNLARLLLFNTERSKKAFLHLQLGWFQAQVHVPVRCCSYWMLSHSESGFPCQLARNYSR